jgi:hypothetical protein
VHAGMCELCVNRLYMCVISVRMGLCAVSAYIPLWLVCARVSGLDVCVCACVCVYTHMCDSGSGGLSF